MKRFALALAVLMTPIASQAETSRETIASVIDTHILPGFEQLALSTKALSKQATDACDSTSERLRASYHIAFDTWISTSHLRFGPTEVEDRAFALAFWPDPRGVTPRTLQRLITTQDPVAKSVGDYAQVSIAARGFYALEFLLFDDAFLATDAPEYHCTLVQTISADIAATSQDILGNWTETYANKMRNPSPDSLYQSNEEVLQELFKALSAGLQFTSETRLGRPLGTFDRPRAKRAEARRSARSSKHVTLSLKALNELAVALSEADDVLSDKLDKGFKKALAKLSDLNDPTFASVSEPQTRIKVEVIQQSVDAVRAIVRAELGPSLGVAAGFNSLDGD